MEIGSNKHLIIRIDKQRRQGEYEEYHSTDESDWKKRRKQG